MYDYHNSADTLKLWTEKRAIDKTFFVFHLILMKLGEIVVHMGNYNFTKFHQNQMKNKKSFINSPFFCSEFQSVSRIVKIVHSASCYIPDIYHIWKILSIPLKSQVSIGTMYDFHNSTYT